MVKYCRVIKSSPVTRGASFKLLLGSIRIIAPLSTINGRCRRLATGHHQNNINIVIDRVSYCRVLYVLLITLLSTWRIVWREGFSCCGGKASIFWREGRSFGGKILFFGGKVIAARQLRPCCKVVLARSLRWLSNPCKLQSCFGKESSIFFNQRHLTKEQI